MDNQLQWFRKSWKASDTVTVCKIIGGIIFVSSLCSKFYKKGFIASRKDIYHILKRYNGEEVTFMFPGKKQHGFTARSF